MSVLKLKAHLSIQDVVYIGTNSQFPDQELAVAITGIASSAEAFRYVFYLLLIFRPHNNII
jgi:hypothetical protein